ncbi:MAG: hypothetical protein M0Z51_00455 [Propionibacterium sp.]|nr:hypothetical protein [Propionibacterium sp.]
MRTGAGLDRLTDPTWNPFRAGAVARLLASDRHASAALARWLVPAVRRSHGPAGAGADVDLDRSLDAAGVRGGCGTP